MTCKHENRDSAYVSDCIENHVRHSCDMILRREADVLTPVFFFNRDMPAVLACISREILSLNMEQRLRKNIYGLAATAISDPLNSWYKSTLADTFKDKSSVDEFCMTKSPYFSDCPIPISFCLEGQIFAPMPQSTFLFVTLTLPPLWQRSREQSFQSSALSVCSPGYGSPGKVIVKKAEFHLFKFRYYPDNGLWYAAQSGSAKKLRLLTEC